MQGTGLVGGLLLWLLLGMAAAHAQGLRPDVLASFGGRYALDCAAPDSPRVLVEAGQLRIEQGDRRFTAGGLDAAFAYFGNNPPRDFRVALLGRVQGRHELTALVSADARGQYLVLDGDRTLLANLGALAKARFRHCNEAANRQAVTDRQTQARDAAAAQAPVPPGTAKYPSELIRDRHFKAAYLRALGPLANTAWLARMNGPAPELTQRRIGGVDYTLAAVCKPRDCGEHNAVLLYDAAQGRVYGLVQQGGRQQVFGAPAPPVQRELAAIWRREWRQGG